MALISVKIAGITIVIGRPTTENPAMDTPRLAFANPYLACMTCGRRAVGTVDPTANLLTGKIAPGARNWPCYHAAGRVSVCDTWDPTTGCPHDPVARKAHGRPGDIDMNQQGQTRK